LEPEGLTEEAAGKKVMEKNNRLFMKKLIIPILIALFSVGCTRQDQPDWDYCYRYFPADEGHWVVYQVDSTAWNKLQDTVISFSYQVRESICGTWTDLTGAEWKTINHDVRKDDSAECNPSATAAQKVTRGTAEKIENNLRFIKLTCPFRKFIYWPGNSYINYDDVYNCNYLGDWLYQYKELFTSRDIEGNKFDSVVVVQQVADSGLICKNLAVEMYAPGIGLIYKHTERLTTQKTSNEPFNVKAESGYIVTYNIIDWRKD
jgi:hypothetical protein